MKLKSKLVAGASAVVMIAVAAPAAHAAITPAGSCKDTVGLYKLTGVGKGVGLGDQTAQVKIAGNIAKDLVAASVAPNAGSCPGTFTRPGDTHVPNGANPTLTPKSAAASLLGNVSCASGATAVAADATVANAYPANGKITWTMNETYTDLTTLTPGHPYKMQADVALLGFNSGAGVDVVDIGGIILTGASVGATVVGNIWEDPVAKAPTGTDPSTTLYNTGYNLDLTDALGCADGTPNNANITAVLSSGGGTHNVSPLAGTASGLAFQFGEP